MQSRWLLNLLLLAAIAALALVAVYEPGIEPAVEARPITDLPQTQVERVRVQRAAHEDLLLTREAAGNWIIEAPSRLPAEAFQVDALTRLAEQKAVRSYPAGELDLARLGLQPAASSVTLNAVRVEFGATEPLEGLRYVRVGEQVHLTPDIYQHLIDAEPGQFVRRRLLPAQAAISGLTLPTVSLRKANGDWVVEPHQELSADRIQQLLDNWQQAAALSVKSSAADQAGERIEVILDDPAQPLVFRITSREPDLLLLRPDLGIEYNMGGRSTELLALPPAPTEPAP